MQYDFDNLFFQDINKHLKQILIIICQFNIFLNLQKQNANNFLKFC